MEQPALYFAYGSNLNEADMALRCPGARPDVVARLEGWRLTFHGVANIEPAPGRRVHGALWWLDHRDLTALDAYEGAPSFYHRRTVEVQTDAGPRTAMTYVMPRPTYVGLPSDWYFERIREGYERWDLPLDELERALAESRADLDRRGIAQYEPDGRKRLRAIIAEHRRVGAG